MKLFLFPSNKESVRILADYCAILAISEPITLNHTHLNHIIKDLLTLNPNNHCPTDAEFEVNVSKTAIPAPVIIFWGAEIQLIRKMIRLYKADKRWPIFAVITKTSMSMTLLCLMEHLIDDRQKELVIKSKRIPSAAEIYDHDSG